MEQGTISNWSFIISASLQVISFRIYECLKLFYVYIFEFMDTRSHVVYWIYVLVTIFAAWCRDYRFHVCLPCHLSFTMSFINFPTVSHCKWGRRDHNYMCGGYWSDTGVKWWTGGECFKQNDKKWAYTSKMKVCIN